MESLKEDIKTANKLLDRARKNLENISLYNNRSNFDKIREECIKYEEVAEKIVNHARLFPTTIGFYNIEDEIKDNILKENKIDISYEHWFKIKMPVLLNKKEVGNPIYIRSTLFFALQDFFRNNNYEKINEKCIIVFKHNYSNKRKYREMRDHDNIELNSVVDLITMYMLKDDNPLCLDHYYFSTNNLDEDSTEIYLIPKKDFVEFLNFINKEGGLY